MMRDFAPEQSSWWRKYGRHVILAAAAAACLCFVLGYLQSTQERREREPARPSLLASTAISAADAVEAAIKNALDSVKEQHDSLHDTKTQGGDGNAATDDFSFEHLPPDVAASMNFSVNPCDNFYEFTCGNWLEDAQIPKDKVRWSRSWDGAKERVLHELALLMTKDWPDDSPFRKLGWWYSSCMDTTAVEAEGADPLQPMLQKIDGLDTLADLQDYFVEAVSYSLPTFMHLDIQLGQRKRGKQLLFVNSGAMVLHKPDMYNASIPEFAEYPAALHKYFLQLNLLAGSTPEEAKFNADRTLELETIFAQWKREDRWHHSWVDDPHGPPLGTLPNLEEVSPSIPWRRIFTKIAEDCAQWNQTCNAELLDGERLVALKAPFWFWKLEGLLNGDLHDISDDTHRNVSISYLKPLFRTHYIYVMAPLLDKRFLDATLRMDHFMNGVEARKARADKCVVATTNALSALSDQAFMASFQRSSATSDGWALLKHLKKAFVANLESVGWMDRRTQAAALRKARKLSLNLGGPEAYKMLPYPVTAASYWNNSRWAYHVKVLHSFMGLGQPVDPRAWSRRASLVNAWYSNYANALFIPSGMLTKPFFSPDYPAAQNFGALGTIMGHEMTHGFDERGAKIDENGHEAKWWSDAVVAEFNGRLDCVKGLYSSFEIGGRAVSGNKTVSENIADFGGLNVAYRAYLSWYRDMHGAEPPLQSQRLFFIAFSQNWCTKQRRQVVEYRLARDVHAPEPFRANGGVAHNAFFARVFSCPLGSPMNPIHKCGIWKNHKVSKLRARGVAAGQGMEAGVDAARQMRQDDAGGREGGGLVRRAGAESAVGAEEGSWRWSPEEGPAQSAPDDEDDDGTDSWLQQRD